MTVLARSLVERIRLAAAAFLLLGLAACATPFSANVSRFQAQLPAPDGQTFAVVASDPSKAGGIEFGQYAHLVQDKLEKLGYKPVTNPENAELIVQFNYGVDDGHERINTTGFYPDPFWGPWYGYGPYWGYPWRHGLWHYGWYDPWFDTGIDSYTVYTSHISLKIDRRSDGKRLFEGRAEAVSTSNRLQYLVPNLIEAMFTGFPGNSGETVRISVAPEKKVNKKSD